MPKGLAAEPRQVVCRACGSEFATRRFGRAAWYCGSDACDHRRGADSRSPARRARRVDSSAAARERFERREAKRNAERRDRRVTELHRDVHRLKPLWGQAVAHAMVRRRELREALRELVELGDRRAAVTLDALDGPPEREAPAPAPRAEASGPVADAAAIARERAARLGSVDRGTLQRAVVRLAHAKGLVDTRAALIDLAAVALAWAARIPDRPAVDP